MAANMVNWVHHILSFVHHQLRSGCTNLQAVKERAEMESQLAADRVDRAQQLEAIHAAQARSQAELAALEADAAQAKAFLADQVQTSLPACPCV